MPPTLVPRRGELPPGRRVLYLAGSGDVPISQDALIFTLPFVALTEAELQRISPDVVMFPLFTASLDATVVLSKLKALGYRGRCVILAPRLPKPKLIEAELREYSGEIEVELLASDAPMD